MTNIIIFSIGLLSQMLFAGRSFVQIFHTEKQKKVANPLLFWELSIIAAILMIAYGILRQDIIILAGQVLNYGVYVRNISLKKQWRNSLFKQVSYIVPWLIISWLFLTKSPYSWSAMMQVQASMTAVMTLGWIGQIIFSSRFFYQWAYSEKKKESFFPLGFWIISIVGGVVLSIYAIIRRDPILLAGQVLGIGMYLRNIYYNQKSLKEA